ncbi:hypothetical protein LTR28_001350, partial [Elasticomyces elasticus]
MRQRPKYAHKKSNRKRLPIRPSPEPTKPFELILYSTHPSSSPPFPSPPPTSIPNPQSTLGASSLGAISTFPGLLLGLAAASSLAGPNLTSRTSQPSSAAAATKARSPA